MKRAKTRDSEKKINNHKNVSCLIVGTVHISPYKILFDNKPYKRNVQILKKSIAII